MKVDLTHIISSLVISFRALLSLSSVPYLNFAQSQVTIFIWKLFKTNIHQTASKVM